MHPGRDHSLIAMITGNSLCPARCRLPVYARQALFRPKIIERNCDIDVHVAANRTRGDAV